MARVKLPKQPVVKPVQSHHLHLVELVECPLCIEPLDATDRDFWPCPCGYQVCLFCYQRLQSEYNNCCPNCRQQYSDDLDGVRQHIARKQQQQKVEATQHARGGASGSSHTAGHHHPHHHAAPHAHGAHGPAGRTKLAGNAAKQRAAHGEGAAHGRGTAHQASEAHNSSLPPTASWAVASAAAVAAGPAGTSTPEPAQQQPQPQQQEPPPPAAGDESAWPSLGAAHQQQRPDTANGHERRRSSSSSSLAAVPQQQQQQQQQAMHRFDASRSSYESTGSTHTAHSERQQRLQHHLQQDEGRHSDSDAQSQAQELEETEQQQQLEQQLERHSSGFTTVEVSTVVSGKRHDVCVHVSHAEEVRVYPEAAVLLDMLQQAVHSSKLSSTEAAVQLVQCLRKLECDSGSHGSKHGTWLQQVLAAKGNGATPHSAGRPPLASRAPPPGFGPTASRAGSTATANGISNSHHQHHHVQQQHHAQQQVQQHELPPAGWSSAQRSFQQQQVHGETPQGSMHSVDSTNSLFSQGSSLSQSMWTDNGLPGVDLGVGVTRLAGGLGSGLPAAVPARLQMLWANGTNGLNSSVSNGLGYGSSTPTGPPPGFGGAAGDLGLGSRLNGTYNPLSFANGGAAQQSSSIGLPPGFGLGADVGAAAASKQQQQLAQPALYQPF